MTTELEKIDYIKENIDKISQLKISKYLGIHCRSLNKIMRDNNILDERLYRYCPSCCDMIFHKNYKARIGAEKEDRKCRKCASPDRIGEKNPFFGKHHTDEMKKFYHETHKGKRYSPDTEFKKGSAGNPISNHESWIKKYGNEIADIKHEAFKLKTSINNSGKGNPMYGKPAPIGSGNGWSGWYKGWYFRSLLELSYMIFVIERFNIKWEPGESKKNKIQYHHDGKIKNYFPDFILNKKYMIECKPKKLWNTEINKIKMEYAKIYCESNGLILKIRDCRKIKKCELIDLYKSGDVKFIEKYELKINEIIQ